MVCRNCGNEIRDDARFCPNCGAAVTPGLGSELPQGAAPYSTASTPAWEGPEGGGKKKTGLFIGLGVAVVAVIALVAVFASGLFGSPKGTVEKAFLKSVAAYKAAEGKLGVPDIEQWQKDQTIQQRMSLELKSINSDLIGYDLSALSGLGLGLRTSFDGESRNMSLELGAVWGDDDLFTFLMGADDDELYFKSPQLTGATYYGVNTETLGADLAEMTGDDSVKDISFNLFELVDMVLEKVDQEAMEEDFREANKALWESAAVKKSGAKTMSINGTETKTTAYQVTIPEEDMKDYVNTVLGILSAMDYASLYRDMFQAMDMPDEAVEDFLYEMENLDPYGDLSKAAVEFLEELGDVRLDVCLSDGYVSAVLYEDYLFEDDNFVSVSVFLGGGEEYVDDLRLEVKVDDQMFIVDSTGDHGLKNGVYTDETVIKGPFPMVTSELSIDPSKDTDNIQWKLGVSDSALSMFVLETSGDYDAKDTYLLLDLEDVSLRVMGMEVCNLAFDYYVDCYPGGIAVVDPKMITQMSEQELQQVAADIQGKAMTWVLQMQQLFASRLPEDLLWAIMGGF